jgi:ATP-dependent DNA ligase
MHTESSPPIDRTKNLYLDADVQLARERGFDICQLKLDGWWCRATHAASTATFYSETDREFARANIVGLDGCTLIGEFMRGTQWSQREDRKGLFFVYDITRLFGVPIIEETYLQRYKMLRRLQLPSTYRLIENFHTDHFESIWQRYILHEGYEGVVFRRSSSTINDAIIRHKRIYTLDGIVIGFEVGNGKYSESLGAVRVSVGKGVTTVGGGFSDAERHHIWANQSRYLGKYMELEASAIFESGAARHPRFVRWREDKQS